MCSLIFVVHLFETTEHEDNAFYVREGERDESSIWIVGERDREQESYKCSVGGEVILMFPAILYPCLFGGTTLSQNGFMTCGIRLCRLQLSRRQRQGDKQSKGSLRGTPLCNASTKRAFTLDS